MAEYFSPGVYVEEIDSSPRAIEGVGTSTAGFIGMAAKGPLIGAPILITNFSEFTRTFGTHLTELSHKGYRFLAHSVEQFFTNGGTRCFVSRVAPSDAALATVTLGPAKFDAVNEGKWGNRIMLTVTGVKRKKIQLIEKKADATYIAKSTDGLSEGDLVAFETEINRIASIIDNTVTFEKPFKAAPEDKSIVAKKLLYVCEMDIVIRCDNEAEGYNSVSLNPVSDNFIDKKLAFSNIVSCRTKTTNDLKEPDKLLLGEKAFGNSIMLAGGSDGNIDKVNAATFIGEDNGPGNRSGISAFAENNLVSIIAVPGVTIPEVVLALVAHCENLKNRFAVIDMPEGLTKTGDVIGYREMIDSTFAAVYHPWIQTLDRSTGKPGIIPPSGAVMGVFSRTDINRGVHKAPANELVYGATGLSVNYTSAEQDIFNPQGVNIIRAIPGQGIRIWGARTASSNSSFKYVNVRRLFIYIEESIKAATNWVVFEPNDATLWSRVNFTVSSFLEGLYRAGMFAGASPAEAYFVDIGPTTMSADDIANGRLICNIGIAPSKPAEFVIFRISQATSQSGAAAE